MLNTYFENIHASVQQKIFSVNSNESTMDKKHAIYIKLK